MNTPPTIEIIKKLLSDPRVVNVMTNVLAEMLAVAPNTNTNSDTNTATQTTPAPANTPKTIDWDAKTNAQLRGLFYYKKKHNQEIDPKMNAVLTERFPGYDPVNQVFGIEFPTKYHTKQSKEPTATVDWDAKTDLQLRGLYGYRKSHNQAIEPELNTVLAKRFSTYDPANHVFMGQFTKQPGRKSNFIDWDTKPDDYLKKVHAQRISIGIGDTLNSALARRFPNTYDPVKRRFVHDYQAPKQKTVVTPTPKPVDTKPVVTPAPKPVDAKPVVAPAPKPVDAKPVVAPAPKPVDAKPVVTPAPKLVDAKPVVAQTPTTINETPAVQGTTQLSVKLKLIKMSLNDAYYDVYINGKRILHNHANTELRLFADNTILGIHGIVTNDKKLPQCPLWLIYKTNLELQQWAGCNMITKRNHYVTNISPMSTGARVTLSNGMTVLLEKEKLKRHAGNKRFEIER